MGKYTPPAPAPTPPPPPATPPTPAPCSLGRFACAMAANAKKYGEEQDLDQALAVKKAAKKANRAAVAAAAAGQTLEEFCAAQTKYVEGCVTFSVGLVHREGAGTVLDGPGRLRHAPQARRHLHQECD